MPAKHDLPTKLRGISKKLHLETSLIWIWHEIFFLEAVTFFDTLHCGLFFVCFWNKGQLWQRLPIPLCHTYSEPFGRALHGTWNHPIYAIPIKKIWVNCVSSTLVNSDFEGPKSRLHSKINYFQSLSDFSNFYAWNHIVCHKYAKEKVYNTPFSTLEPIWK